jgi:hypothetical protein
MPRTENICTGHFHFNQTLKIHMKKIQSLIVLLFMFATVAIAQDGKPKSPKETVSGTIDGAKIEIVYCRPSARGRVMIGGKEPFGTVWRTGANRATTIELSKAVKIEGQDLAAGKYSLFTIPGEKDWVIIFNKQADQSGAFEYEQYKSQDVLRVTVPVNKPAAYVETFTITVDNKQVNLQWENTAVAFKVKG